MAAKPPQKLVVPATLADVNAKWLTRVLSSSCPGVEVTSAKISGFIGYKPNKARVELKYNAVGKKAGLPPSLFVKGGFKGASAAAVSGIDAGLDIGTELEILAYDDLVPHLDVNTPRCFAAIFDRAAYNGIIVMEDMALSKVTFMKPLHGLNYPQAAGFVEALAKTHAPWMNSPELEKGGRFGPTSSLAERSRRLQNGYLNQMATHSHWGDFAALPRGAATPRAFQDSARVAAAQLRMNEIHQACARTIIHGDEHQGNLFIDAKGQPGFIDWCARIEPWVMSFTYFLVCTVDTLDRRQWERPLLKRYLEQLTRLGAAAPDFDEAWYMYRCTTLYPFLVWFNNSAKWQPEALNTRNTVRGAQAMLDHDAFTLLGV